MEIQQKDNETLAAYIHFLKQQWSNALLTITPLQLKYKKDPQTLAKVIRLFEKLDAAQQLTTKLTPSTVSMMSNDDRCVVCGPMGHFGCHCPDAVLWLWWIWPHCTGLPQQDFSIRNAMPPRHLRHWYIYTQRGRSHSSYYGPRHRRHFSRSQSHCDRSSSFWRHILCSSSSNSSSLCCPLANGCPHHHSHHDTSNWCSCNPSCTHHFSHRYHSFHYSMDWSHSHSSNSHCTVQETAKKSQAMSKTFNPP